MNGDLISLHSLLGGSKSPDLKNEELTILTNYFFNTKNNDLYTRDISDDNANTIKYVYEVEWVQEPAPEITPPTPPVPTKTPEPVPPVPPITKGGNGADGNTPKYDLKIEFDAKNNIYSYSGKDGKEPWGHIQASKNLFKKSKQKTKKETDYKCCNNCRNYYCHFISPLNPKNARLKSPAATYKIGVPWKASGIFAILSLLRTPLIITILKRNPRAEPIA